MPANAGDTRDDGLIPGSGRSFGVGNGNPLQYSCLEKFLENQSLMSYSPWVCKKSDLTEHTHTHTHTHTQTHTDTHTHTHTFIYKSEEYGNTRHIFLITTDRLWLSQLEMCWNTVLTVVETDSPLFLTAFHVNRVCVYNFIKIYSLTLLSIILKSQKCFKIVS